MLGAEHAAVEPGDSYHTVLLLWGNLEVFGTADEVLILAGHVTFHPGSKLTKSLVVMGGSYETLPGAEVTYDNVVFRAPGRWWGLLQSGISAVRENITWIAYLTFSAFLILFYWLFTLLTFRLFPGLKRSLVDKLWREWPKNLLAGAIGAVVVPVFFSLLVISIFGILLLPLYLILLFVGGALAYAAAALWAGHRILPARRAGQVRSASVLLGLVAFHLLWSAGVWWSVLPALFLWLLGWGAMVRALRGIWR